MSARPLAARARQSSVLVAALVAGALAAERPARADDDAVAEAARDRSGAAAPEAEPDPFRTKPGYAQFFLTTFVGDGLRFNNPYRLATPLGGDAESLSRTAPYVDVGLGVTLGDPLGLQHGVAARASTATSGVGQVVLTPSYLAWRRWRSIALYGRAGVPVVMTPALTWGLEASLGAAWFFLGGVGVAAEAVGDLFYGAGTREHATVTYPVLSGQLGLVFAYEVLP